MIRLAFLSLACVAAAIVAAPEVPALAAQGKKQKGVKQVEGKFTPADAKPGQTVTFTLTVDLNEGYYTYPTVQTDKAAAAMVNVIKFPEGGSVIFVGKLEDPKNVKTKAEPELRIGELRYCPDSATYTRKAVVSPKAAAGSTSVKLASFNLSVCDKENCYPARDVPVEAKIKVLEGPAVPVEKEYAEEVKQALGEK